MANKKAKDSNQKAVDELVDALNEDLAREYQAIIAYTVYSNVLKGAQWMNIAAELKVHAAEELQHALVIADQIDYLGGMPTGEAEGSEAEREGGGDAALRSGITRRRRSTTIACE